MSKLETNKYQAMRIFRQAKSKSQSLFSQREVPARLVNQVIGYKAFEEPQQEWREEL
jgi:hypothetical protein